MKKKKMMMMRWRLRSRACRVRAVGGVWRAPCKVRGALRAPSDPHPPPLLALPHKHRPPLPTTHTLCACQTHGACLRAWWRRPPPPSRCCCWPPATRRWPRCRPTSCASLLAPPRQQWLLPLPKTSNTSDRCSSSSRRRQRRRKAWFGSSHRGAWRGRRHGGAWPMRSLASWPRRLPRCCGTCWRLLPSRLLSLLLPLMLPLLLLGWRMDAPPATSQLPPAPRARRRQRHRLSQSPPPPPQTPSRG